MSKNYGNSGSPLAQYETIIVGAYKDNMEQLMGTNCLKFIVLLSYHDQLSKGILAAASQALKTTVESSTERENIIAHLEKCLGTQLSVFINKNKGTLDRDLEECKKATQEGIEYFENSFQKRLKRLPSTVSDDGDVDEYVDTLVRKSTSKTLKHLEKTYNNINKKELTFRIEDLVNDQREEVSETVFKTVTFIKGDSRILKHRDGTINTKKTEAEKRDGSQTENSDSEESLKWTGEKNGVLHATKIDDNDILIEQHAQLSQNQQPQTKLLQPFKTQKQQQPQDQLQQPFWTQQQQQQKHQQQQRETQQQQQQQPQLQQQQPQHEQQQPQQPDSPLPEHKTPPVTWQRQEEQQKPPTVRPRQKKQQPQFPHQQQLEDKGNNHLDTPQVSYPINSQVDTKHSSQEDKGDKNKPTKGFRHAVSSIKNDLKKINVSKLSNLVGEVTRKEPNTSDLGPAVVPLSNLYQTGVRAHSPEEVMQTTKLTSKEMNQMSTFSGEKQATIGFLITNSRVYVLQRTANQMQGIVRSFHITLPFEFAKIELNGNVTQVLVEFNVLDLLGTNRRLYIDKYEVAAEDIISEYFHQITQKLAEENNITNENAIIIQSANLSNFQTQRLKSALNGINFQSQQLMSLHSLMISSLCQHLGKGSPAETHLIIHFTKKDFEATVARVSYSSANILGYADHRDIANITFNSQLFLNYHKELCSKAATNSNLPSETITKAMDFYNQIVEKTLTALKPQTSQMIKTVYIVFERNLNPLKSYLKNRLAFLKNRTIETIFEDEVLGTTGLPSVPCDDLYKYNLWILLNNASVKFRLLEKSKPVPKRESMKEFQLPPPLQPTFDLFSSNDEKKSYRFGNECSSPLKLILTTFPDGTYQIHFKNSSNQFISFHDFASS